MKGEVFTLKRQDQGPEKGKKKKKKKDKGDNIPSVSGTAAPAGSSLTGLENRKRKN